jgi:hypothetical protein
MSFLATSGVSVGDIDGDGLFELITATMIGGVYAWDLTTPATCANSDWPMRHINPRNTNVFEDIILALPPGEACAPGPANTATDVNIITELNWTPGREPCHTRCILAP